MSDKSIMSEVRDTQIAIELINFGARMQVLESETGLSRRKLLKLYKELKGTSPSKGMLPFSAEWYMSWEQNIHSSIFYNIYCFIKRSVAGRPVELMLKAYRIYLAQCLADMEEKPVLELTRAWTLLRFIDNGLIKQVECSECKGKFISTPEYMFNGFTCSLCVPPSRAMKKCERLNLSSSA